MKSISVGIIGFLLILCLAPSLTRAGTFQVKNAAELQKALTTASANGEHDEIMVAAGILKIPQTLTYDSSENFSLTIRGAGPGRTTLDGGNTAKIGALNSTNAEGHLTIRGITFQNGNNRATDFGGGLSLEVDAAAITIEDSEFKNNFVNRHAPETGNGGGVFANSNGGAITIRNSTFTGNSATNDGGGISAWTDHGTILIAGNSFTDNTTAKTGGDDAGGASACSNNGKITIQENTFRNNSAGDDGGGAFVYFNAPGGQATIKDNTFVNNRAGLNGGGAYARSPAEATIIMANNTFIGNSAAVMGGGSFLYLQSGSAGINNNKYDQNKTPTRGGDSDGAGLWVWTGDGRITLTGNIIKKNQASRNGGGGDLSTDSGKITLENNAFAGNAAANVGGGLSLAVDQGQLALANNTFYDNSASDGGGINFYAERAGTVLQIYNTIIWKSTPQAISQAGAGPVAARYSNIQGGAGRSWFGKGSIAKDPLFADAKGHDFHIRPGSPCIDAGEGTKAPALDFEGQSRWDDPKVPNTGLGPPWADIGIDEYHPASIKK